MQRKKYFQLFKRSDKRRKFIVYAIFLVLFLGSAYIARNILSPTYIMRGATYTRDWKGQILEAKVDLHKVEGSKVKAKVLEDKEIKSWEIVDNSQNPPFPTGIYFYDTSSLPSVQKWNEYLIGYSKDYFVAESGGAYLGAIGPVYSLQSTIRHIRVLNTQTEEVYSISLQKPTWGEIDLVSAQIIDNVYFLKIGSYGPRSAGFQYRLQLPPSRNSKVEKLQFPIGSIVLRFGNYYLTAFCYEGCTYQRVNIHSLQSTELSRLNKAANTYAEELPERLMGFTKDGEMILEITEEHKQIAVSLVDEKTSREFDPAEEIISSNIYDNNSSIGEQFKAMNLGENYILVERTAKYQIPKIGYYNKDNMPFNAIEVK